MSQGGHAEHFGEAIATYVREQRMRRAGFSEQEIAQPPAPMPDDERQTWTDIAACVLDIFGVRGGAAEVLVQDDTDALAALENVLVWARSRPDHVAEGGATGISYQRGRVIATDVLPERTIGVSTYRTPIEAAQKLDEMERGYRAWMRSVGKTPNVAAKRRAERSLGIPEDFGGLIGGWLSDEHAFVAHVAHGRIVEVMRLTPLNLLQLRTHADHLIRLGKKDGQITEDHEREAASLPPMPPSEYDPDYAPKD